MTPRIQATLLKHNRSVVSTAVDAHVAGELRLLKSQLTLYDHRSRVAAERHVMAALNAYKAQLLGAAERHAADGLRIIGVRTSGRQLLLETERVRPRGILATNATNVRSTTFQGTSDARGGEGNG